MFEFMMAELNLWYIAWISEEGTPVTHWVLDGVWMLVSQASMLKHPPPQAFIRPLQYTQSTVPAHDRSRSSCNYDSDYNEIC